MLARINATATTAAAAAAARGAMAAADATTTSTSSPPASGTTNDNSEDAAAFYTTSGSLFYSPSVFPISTVRRVPSFLLRAAANATADVSTTANMLLPASDSLDSLRRNGVALVSSGNNAANTTINSTLLIAYLENERYLESVSAEAAGPALAGYTTWSDFTENCCCVAFSNQTRGWGAHTVERWTCSNGRVKERMRVSPVRALSFLDFFAGFVGWPTAGATQATVAGSRFTRPGPPTANTTTFTSGGSFVSGLGVRRLCATDFDAASGCSLVLDASTGLVRLTGCNEGMFTATELRMW
jgi:hypothetical protein